MIERMVSHPAGRFMRCRSCGAEPRHVRSRGRLEREPVSFASCTDRHALECSACAARTARHATLEQAEAEWGADFAQLSLPLRPARRRRTAA